MIKVKRTIMGKDEVQFDVRRNHLRTRRIISCSDEIAKIIEDILLLINENDDLSNVGEQLIRKDLYNAVYDKYQLEPTSLSADDTEKVNKVVDNVVLILDSLNKKKSDSPKMPAVELLKKIESENEGNFIKTLLLGQFGYGKSTIIKAMSNFGEEVDFPVIDTSRTTSYTTHYIFKRDTSSIFRFSVDFKDEEKIFNLVSDGVYRAVDKIFNSLGDNDDRDKTRDKAMHEFVNDPNHLFKIEYILGKYYKTDQTEKRESKEEQVKFWDDIFERIYSCCQDFYYGDQVYEELGSGLFKKNLKDEFIKDEDSVDALDEITLDLAENLRNKLLEICKEQEEKNLGSIEKDGDSIVGFKVDNYDVQNISDYIVPFASTDSKDFTKIVTPLVERMVIEIPYNNKIGSEYKNKVICVTDTVGFEHSKTEDSKSLEGSTDYKYNAFDIIAVVDKATGSMSGTTENILNELYNNANKSKIMILYTFYDEFSKKDFEDDEDKKMYLLNLQNTTIRKLDDELLSTKFAEELSQKNRTLFLENLLVPEKKSECMDNVISNLEQRFEGLYDFKRFDVIDNKKSLIDFNYSKLALVFNKARETYINQQYDIYMRYYPHYKTTEALTNRLSNGGTYFIGSTRTLKPIDDFCSTMMSDMDKFIKNPKSINFETKDTIQNHEQKVLDWFKEEVSSEIKTLSKEYFVDMRRSSWRELYMYHGTGSDYERRQGIMMELNAILPPLITENNTFADKWIERVEKIFEEVLYKMKVQANG
ncbi:hypothetical protein HMPREF1143_0421 [Peptoanaerobacter stomatis]|uniref:Uncharacterized protein n=1 Tax=Peptoanaerobacter stomatis TaxID=796937 RepID=J4WAT6_9FIRM|nr:hypothetical protein [Peptoanaerobacter stomatis]EJU22726.1 hypothetical protein HMPREF1143_0421 [Peptoanaerobacter stomatis]NWO25683.1 hypothetical protein [Peptostreptococcaceae bacterium oral taxon 081]